MRTGTVSYKLEDLKKGVIIPIGFVGENDFTRVIFDAEEIYKKFPNASVSMKVQPPKGGIYPATVTRDGNTVIWQVKEADVANRGGGELQLTFTDGETKIKTYIAKTDVKRSLEGNGPAPDPVQDWIDDADEKLVEVKQATQDAEAAASHQPYIGVDGYWYTWNGEEFVKNVKAQGDKGDPGDPGSPGDPTQLIDDTAGEGQTGKTWSADKLDETTRQLLTAIQGVNDIDNLLIGELPGTTQTVTFDANDNPATITHSKNGETVRTDVFTWGTDTVTEVRTAYGKYITITTDLTTLQSVISEVQEVA